MSTQTCQPPKLQLHGTRQKPVRMGDLINMLDPNSKKEIFGEMERRGEEAEKRQKRQEGKIIKIVRINENGHVGRVQVINMVQVKCAKLAAKPSKFLLEKCADPASISPSSFNPEKRNILKRASFSKQ